MPWKAKNKLYVCTRCVFRLGCPVGVALKRILPAERCPECGGRLNQIRCDHPDVRPLAGNMSCRVCHRIVVWEEPKP